MKRIATRAIATILIAVGLFVSTVAGSDSELFRQFPDSLAAAMVTVDNQPLTIDSSNALDDYLTLAARRSPALRSAYFKWQAALEQAGYAGALPDPMFSYAYFVENVETRVGPQNHRFGLRQSFPWFGTLGTKKDMASEAANATYEQFQAERLKLFYRVKAAYYDYYFLSQDIAITGANLELLTFWESVARTKYKTALRQHPDVIRAQVELGLLEDRLLSLQDMVEPATARLRAAINVPDSILIPFPSEIAVAELLPSKTAIINSVREYNPDLLSIGHLVEKEKAGIRLAKKSYLPSFSVGVDYIETGPAMNPATSESGKDPWMIGVSVSLPIWFGKNNAQKQEAIARHMQAEYRLEETENQIEAYAIRVLFEHNDALRKLRLYRDGLIPKAEQSLNASYTAYQAGELDFLNVLDAQRQLLEFQRQYERAVADLGIRQAELETVTGRPTIDLVE